MHSGRTGMLAIREGPWKLIDSQAGEDAEPGAPPQLYNLAEDPGEKTDVYSQHREIADGLQQLLHKIKSEGRSRDIGD